LRISFDQKDQDWNIHLSEILKIRC
jgi:hypothetical protein